MTRTERAGLLAILCGTSLLAAGPAAGEDVPADLSGFRSGPGVTVRHEGDTIAVAWPIEGGETGRLVLDLRPGVPLIALMGLSNEKGEEVAILAGVDPLTTVTVGSRLGTNDRPPGMSPFNTFFDAPAKRPHQTYKARLDLKRARVTGGGPRATVILGGLAAGPFSGTLQFTVYSGTRLVHVEAVMSTAEDNRAYLYDAGLVALPSPSWRWALPGSIPRACSRRETSGSPGPADKAIRVRHRARSWRRGRTSGDARRVLPAAAPVLHAARPDLYEPRQRLGRALGHRGPGGSSRGSASGDRVGDRRRQHTPPWFNAPRPGPSSGWASSTC